jgi:hypothetical protein
MVRAPTGEDELALPLGERIRIEVLVREVGEHRDDRAWVADRPLLGTDRSAEAQRKEAERESTHDDATHLCPHGVAE